QSMLGRGSFGVGRRTQVLAGRSFSSFAVLSGSAGGTPSRDQAGACGPVRRSVVPGLTPYFAVPSPSILSAATVPAPAPFVPAATVHAQVRLVPRATAKSASPPAAGRNPFAGPSGHPFPASEWVSSSQASAAVS